MPEKDKLLPDTTGQDIERAGIPAHIIDKTELPPSPDIPAVFVRTLAVPYNSILTSNLGNLDTEPVLRGCVDAFNGVMIRGWALSTDSLMKKLEVDLYICGVKVARTTTHLKRADIARRVSLPIKAGFQIGINGIATDKVNAVLSEMKKIEAAKVTLKSIISVRIAGTDKALPFSVRLRQELIEIAPLIEIFDNAMSMKTRNEYISIRDRLLDKTRFSSDENQVKAIAYYLPQFHPFSENNEWWGTGFTEWTNVVTAKPYLPDHYQPHLPADLGFYDLRVDAVHEDQITLAKQYGLSGFCYYYYWFSGKTLMTMPIDRHLEKGYDFDFCLCWANENWSRRWDGSENDLLMAQRHVAEDDVTFIRSCLKYFRSDHYIKIDGAPLLQVYRISLLEKPQETIARWREIVMAEGFPGLHVTMVETFGLDKPYDYGCDSSCQFPPHGIIAENRAQEFTNRDPAFTGKIYDYAETVRNEVARPVADHLQFRAAMPSWDNTSRKSNSGTIFHGATPALFEMWLTHLVEAARSALPKEQQFVFINAWNEWAEGAHLEPDRKNGHAYLQAVRRALAQEHKALAALGAEPDDGSGLRQLVERLMNANAQLKLLLNPRYGLMAARASRFVHVDEDLVDVVAAPAESRAWIETVNGRDGLDLRLVLLSREQGLILRGWVQAPQLNLSKTIPFFVSLKKGGLREPLSQRYMATVFDRESRADVLQSLGPEGSAALWCGFTAQLNLRDLPQGRYELEIVVMEESNLAQGCALSAHITVIVS